MAVAAEEVRKAVQKPARAAPRESQQAAVVVRLLHVVVAVPAAEEVRKAVQKPVAAAAAAAAAAEVEEVHHPEGFGGETSVAAADGTAAVAATCSRLAV